MSIATASVNISMPNKEVEAFNLVPVGSEWFRLVPSRFPPVSLYERVISNDQLDELVDIENMTNPRLKSAAELTGGIHPVDPASPRLQNWNLAPFAYSNPAGGWLFRRGYPSLELAEDLQTALAISVRLREEFLSRTNEPPIGLEMRVLKNPVTGRFLDLRRLPSGLSKAERWAMGDAVVRAGLDGALFCSSERPSAICIAILKGATLGRGQQTKHFHFMWNGNRISALYAFDDVRELSPEELSKADDVIAA